MTADVHIGGSAWVRATGLCNVHAHNGSRDRSRDRKRTAMCAGVGCDAAVKHHAVVAWF